jgi:predicted outer membrane repeat protein
VLCTRFSNEKYVGNGGAIESTMNTGENIMVFGSTFEGNKASNGGAIYAGGISIISSTFNDNNANGTDGGAAYIGSGYVRNSMFTMNDAIGSGPAVFSSDQVCTMGLNHACHSYDHQENTCDGIVSTSGDCIKFASSCEYPSSTPTVMPSLEPSLSPSVSSQPSQEPSSVPSSSMSPTTSPTAMPSSEPSRTPTATPSTIPTEMPSSSPSSLPTSSPSREPSTLVSTALYNDDEVFKIPSISPCHTNDYFFTTAI